MPLSYHFKCSNGHEFEAVAKLRSRCPECQTMTFRRNTSSSVLTDTTPKSTVGEAIIPSSSPTSIKEEVPETSDTGSTLPSSTKPSSEDGKSVKSTKPTARILRQGRVQPAKKPISVIKRAKAPMHSLPAITKKPEGSHRHAVEGPRSSYGMTMMEKHFGFGRKRPQ